MILPDDQTLFILASVFGATALLCIGLLQWLDDPEKIKGPARAAFKLILRILAYPITVLGIVLVFNAMMIFTIVRYTADRVSAGPTRNYRVKVSFE